MRTRTLTTRSGASSCRARRGRTSQYRRTRSLGTRNMVRSCVSSSMWQTRRPAPPCLASPDLFLRAGDGSARASDGWCMPTCLRAPILPRYGGTTIRRSMPVTSAMTRTACPDQTCACALYHAHMAVTTHSWQRGAVYLHVFCPCARSNKLASASANALAGSSAIAASREPR